MDVQAQYALEGIARGIDKLEPADLGGVEGQLENINDAVSGDNEKATPARIAKALERIADVLEKSALPIAKKKSTL